MTADRLLWWLMRLDACVVLCAAPCALLPFEWMSTVHRDWLGLGELPDAVITRYMARSLSLLYALHGAVVFTITIRWREYRSMVPVLAYLHTALGAGVFLADLNAGVPWWWVASEGPGLVAFGLVKLFLYRRASRAGPVAS
ncbi:hypothetical protein R5W23_000870 [Gemmata sp. JC673]|uniref:DUF2127 domain-containing protein n=1 Tax=Gemmata algarum TaxID=2975278 RepID=A0ABU5EZ02_9BACT|nr:hypothetical protein [Gemmata algarum]MDY3559712.1 hypothetical protein [Gemmata algarum]